MANAQTRATKKYQASKGIIKKSFTLEKDLVQTFKNACASAGISQSAAIRTFMKEFIAEHESPTQQEEAPE